MGRRGPRPEPTRLRVLKGNPGRRPLNDAEPKPRPIPPACPDWLSNKAKRIFHALADQLERLELLTEADAIPLAALAQEWAQYRQAQEILNREGLTCEHTNKAGATNRVTRPEVGIAHKSFLAVKALCAEFGLTPSGRTRIRVEVPKKTDDFEEFVSRGPAGKRG